MSRWAVAILLAAGPLSAQTPAQAKPERRIFIGIKPRVAEVSLVFKGAYRVTDVDGLVHVLARRRFLAGPLSNGLKLGRWRLAAEARLEPATASGVVEIDGIPYAGAIILRRDPAGNTLTVIEEIGIEEYLLGVLPYEMEPDWPIEALKAQAVVARTFAYTQLGKYRDEGYDLSADTRSQVYRGRLDKSPSVRQAVEQTRGEVLGYKGQIVNVYYHACCGGHTAHASAIWRGERPPPLLWGVKDRYCRDSPLRTWKAYFSYREILAALQRKRLIGGALKRFEIASRDKAGYVRSFAAKVGGETFLIHGNDLRKALGGTRLRSTRIERVRVLAKGVEFRGSGLGHGVGLCQWGARLQAERGRRYESILKFYFPGSTLSVVDE